MARRVQGSARSSPTSTTDGGAGLDRGERRGRPPEAHRRAPRLRRHEDHRARLGARPPLRRGAGGSSSPTTRASGRSTHPRRSPSIRRRSERGRRPSAPHRRRRADRVTNGRPPRGAVTPSATPACPSPRRAPRSPEDGVVSGPRDASPHVPAHGDGRRGSAAGRDGRGARLGEPGRVVLRRLLVDDALDRPRRQGYRARPPPLGEQRPDDVLLLRRRARGSS